MRNGFQHIDENIEKWATQKGFPPFADRTICTRSVLNELSLSESAFMRNIDPETLVLSFGTDEYDLCEIFNALSAVANAAQGALP